MARPSLTDLRLTTAIVVALVSLVESHTVISTECPEIDSGKAVYLAHENDCTKFYQCSQGKKILMQCPTYNEEGDRLYYNATLQVCDWPENVKCELPYPRAASVIPPKVEIPTKCPKIDSGKAVYLAHENDCTKFYQCSQGEKVLIQCPTYNEEGGRLYFNATLQVCDWPENVKCELPYPRAASVIPPKVDIPTECPKIDSGKAVYLAHENDCTKFYQLMQCPAYNQKGDKLYFNATLQVCDWPENVKCELPYPRAASVIPPKVDIPTECPKIDSGKAVYLAHENDCTKFYQLMQCPAYNQKGDKLYFNATLQVCDWPENVKCDLPYPRAASVIAPKVDIPMECPKIDSGKAVHLAHENDCTKFYQCSQGKKILMQCPTYNEEGGRLYFNATLQICDWPENVKCELPYPRAASVIPPKVEIPTECPKIDSGKAVYLAHENDCTKFYQCSQGEKVLIQCPTYNEEGDRLYFNATLQVCDWPENVKCELPYPRAASVIPPKVDIPTECPKIDSGKAVYLAHENDCTKFYQCSQGKKILMQCSTYNEEGDRLYYNATLQVCDWPENVKCELPYPRAASVIPPKVEIPTECPKIDSGEVVHLAHENDCTKFYKCDRGEKVLMQCPTYNEEGDRLYFNAALQVCDWPANVDCQFAGGPTIPDTTTTVPAKLTVTSSAVPTTQLTTTTSIHWTTTTSFTTITTTTKPFHSTFTTSAVTTTYLPTIPSAITTVLTTVHPTFTSSAVPTSHLTIIPSTISTVPTTVYSTFTSAIPTTITPSATTKVTATKLHHADDEALMNILGFNDRFRW